MASKTSRTTKTGRTAGTKRTSGKGKKTAAGNKSRTSNRKVNTRGKKKRAQQESVVSEVVIWITLAVSILLLLSNFGLGGMAGDTVSFFLQDMCGFVTYLLPFALFGLVTFAIANRGVKAAYFKMAMIILVLVFICMLADLIYEAGGLLGEALNGLFIPAIGVAGTYVVCVTLMIIAIVLLSGKSLLRMVREWSSEAYGRTREDMARRREIARERREEKRLAMEEEREAEKERRREERARLKEETTEEGAGEAAGQKRKSRRVSGVSFNTTIGDGFGKRKSPEIKELAGEALAAAEEEQAGTSKEKIKTERPAMNFVINRASMPDTAEEEPEDTGMTKAAEISGADMERPRAEAELAADISNPARAAAEQTAVGTDADAVEADGQPSGARRKLGAAAVAGETALVEEAVAAAEEKPKKEYKMPPLSLLKRGKKGGGDSDAHLRETAQKLQDTLHNFGVNVTVTNVSCGPSVTRYELQPEQGVKVSKIVGLTDDIKLNLAAADIRIEAPIPGKAAVGIEVPNKENATVSLRDLLESSEFKNNGSKIAFAAGRDIAGKAVVADIAKMPHLLVAGATGSGKSVCINTLIMSILYEATPEEVKLIMVDPKVVELSVYNGIPHLMIPVVTDPKKAAGALNWAVAEMNKRYQLFAQYNVRDLKGFNTKVEQAQSKEGEETIKKMPQIVIIVDELADLMMVAPGEVEEAICRLAQLARAAGIHLVLATQRPSVNVITGLIKANMPSRIAFSVSSGVDSRTIIDMNGAEKLLGKGDMLFYPSGYQKPARVQGAFVSDKEVQDVVEYLKKQAGEAAYDEEVAHQVNTSAVSPGGAGGGGTSGDERDAYFVDAGKFIIEKEKASIGMLQRVFKIGFNRAARIMDQLCEAGVVGEEEGTKPRKVLMSMEQFEQYIDEYI